MTAEEMRNEFHALYNMMANSNDVAFMHVFGKVMTEMMDYLIQVKPEVADDMIQKLESVKWANYITAKEAEKIVAAMNPKAPWTREQWKAVMEQREYPLEKEPCYNQYALWVVMNAIMSDSSETLTKYVGSDKLFEAVHDLAVDKLQDKDNKFVIREYFGL